MKSRAIVLSILMLAVSTWSTTTVAQPGAPRGCIVIARSAGARVQSLMPPNMREQAATAHCIRSLRPRTAMISPDDKLTAMTISVSCKSCGQKAQPKRHRRNPEPVPEPTFPDQGSCLVTVQRQYCRVITSAPTVITQCYWVPEHYQGVWDPKRKCCQLTSSPP